MSRTPVNRVVLAMPRVFRDIDRADPVAAERLDRATAQACANLPGIGTLLNRAVLHTVINASEANTLRQIANDPQARVHERAVLLIVLGELAGHPLVHIRHSVLGLQARPAGLVDSYPAAR